MHDLGAKSETTMLGGIVQAANCLAKALFDNIAESPDELAFRKSDILTVLEQNTNGLEGWWLCSLRGRQGIVPGNRLRLLAGMYEDPLSPTAGCIGGTLPTRGSNGSAAKQARRRSWHINPTKVLTPQKVGDVYLYDVPRDDNVPIGRLEQSASLDAYDVPPSAKSYSPHKFSSSSLDGSQVCYDLPPDAYPSSAYDVPRSHHEYDTSADLYDTPRSNRFVDQSAHTYDVPDSGDMAYDIPISHIRIADNTSVDYDVPPTRPFGPTYATPPPQSLSNRCSGVSLNSTGSSATSSSSSSGLSAVHNAPTSPTNFGSNRSSFGQPHDIYDIPPSDIRKVATLEGAPDIYDVPTNNSPAPLSRNIAVGVYDVPPQVTRDVTYRKKDESVANDNRLSSSSLDSMPVIEGRDLPLELNSAMETLVMIQQQVHGAITKLFSYVSPNWRRKDNVDSKIYDVKQACIHTKTVLQEFVNFAQGTLVNSTQASDKSLSKKLAKLVKPLNDANGIIQKLGRSVEESGWQLFRQDDVPNGTPDELDQFVACAKSVNDDIRQIASFIQGNCTLLFRRSEVTIKTEPGEKPKILPKPSIRKKAPQIPGVEERSSVQNRPLPLPPSSVTSIELVAQQDKYADKETEWSNEYDYVSMEPKEAVERENNEMKASLPKQMIKNFEKLVEESRVPIEDASTLANRALSDRLIVKFYDRQVDRHMEYLTNAIDAFLMTVENNQPPKVFVAHTKFVILAAHKIVYVADTMHRNIEQEHVKEGVCQLSNSLCDSLKHVVGCTKTAAAHFPSVTAVQSMIDSVVDVSHLANDLKLVISQAAAF